VRTLAAPDFATLREVLRDEIARLRKADALRPVTVIVPGDLAREEMRRDLAARTGGTLGIAVAALGDWVRDLTGPEIARRGGRALSDAGVARLVARVLEDRGRGGRAGPLGLDARTAGLGRAVVRTISDLRRGGFPASALADARPPAAPAEELAEVLRDLERALAQERLWDRLRSERLAADVLRSRADGEPRIFFGFHDLTALRRGIVEAAGAAGPVVLLIPGRGGIGTAATDSLFEWARSRGEASSVESGSTAPVTLSGGLLGRPVLTDSGPLACELRTFPTEAAEVRGIARRILREVEERGRAFDEILVTVPQDGPRPAIFRRIFARAGIPLADRAGVPASETEAGRRATALARGLAAPGGLPDELAGAFARATRWADAAARLRELHETAFGEPPGAEVDAALDAIELAHGSRACRARDVAAALAETLATTTQRGRIGARDEDACVLLVRPEGARALRRPFVWHAGLVEGAIRRVPPEDPLLPDRLREGLAAREAGRSPRTRAELRDEKLLLARFAFECAEQTTVLSWAVRARAGGEPRNPSALLLDLASGRAGTALEPRDAAFRETVPSPDPREARERPVDRADLELAILGGGLLPSPPDLARLARDPLARHVPAALRAAEERWRPGALTAWDGVLEDPRAIEAAWRRVDPKRRAPSPTALESLANCPFAFLVERVLGLGRDPEPEDDWSPVERGLAFHEIVEAVYRKLRSGGLLPLDAGRLDAGLAALDREIGRWRDLLEREPPARRALRRATLAALRDDVAAVLARDAHPSAEDRGVPTWFELPFGMEGEGASFALGDGARLPIRGKADRVDLRPDGAVEVVDFKTGPPRAQVGRVTSTEGEKTSVHLQLPLYLDGVSSTLGRRAERALFYHATADAGFEEVSFDARDLEIRREPLGRLLAAALEHARKGWFPCTPGDACCRRTLARACGPGVAARFRRKRTDPALAAHLARLAACDPPEDPA
jgi:hypothetical protein